MSGGDAWGDIERSPPSQIMCTTQPVLEGGSHERHRVQWVHELQAAADPNQKQWQRTLGCSGRLRSRAKKTWRWAKRERARIDLKGDGWWAVQCWQTGPPCCQEIVPQDQATQLTGAIASREAVSNTRPIAKPKPKMDFQHNIYSLQQTTYIEDSF